MKCSQKLDMQLVNMIKKPKSSKIGWTSVYKVSTNSRLCIQMKMGTLYTVSTDFKRMEFVYVCFILKRIRIWIPIKIAILLLKC